MANAGWYPDPAGGGGYRHWDGESWSEQTTDDPDSSPPGPARTRGRDGGVGLRTAVIVGLAVIVACAIILAMLTGGGTGERGGFKPVAPDTNSSTPKVPGWDESSSPSAPPTLGQLVDCPRTSNKDSSSQRNDGRIRGGGLSYQRVPGWREEDIRLQWASDLNSQMDSVRPGWMSHVGVGQLNAEDGFTDLRTSAHQTVQCFASSGYFRDFTHRIDLADEPYSVSGHSGWRLRAEIHVKNPKMPEIEGDVVDIVVVDYGDPKRFGLWVSAITIGDERRQRLHDTALASLRVE